MSERRARIIIVENRRMIQDILVDILEARGFSCVCVASLADDLSLLSKDDRTTLLMVDVGLFGGREAALAALAHVPELGQRKTMLFSCVESQGGPDVYLLRSPRDFSAIADVVEAQLTPTRPARLGELLVETGVLTPSALQAVLAVQEELGILGRRPLLGQLLVSLGFVSQAEVTRALRAQGKLPVEDESPGDQ
jgi:CheY-like chemotaxis protein